MWLNSPDNVYELPPTCPPMLPSLGGRPLALHHCGLCPILVVPDPTHGVVERLHPDHPPVWKNTCLQSCQQCVRGLTSRPLLSGHYPQHRVVQYLPWLSYYNLAYRYIQSLSMLKKCQWWELFYSLRKCRKWLFLESFKQNYFKTNSSE